MRLIDADSLSIGEINPVDYGSMYSYEAHSAVRDCLSDIERLIDNAPIIEAVPVVHGKWIPITNGRGGNECSECHIYAPSYQNGMEYLSEWCPNCAAKMDL